MLAYRERDRLEGVDLSWRMTLSSWLWVGQEGARDGKYWREVLFKIVTACLGNILMVAWSGDWESILTKRGGLHLMGWSLGAVGLWICSELWCFVLSTFCFQTWNSYDTWDVSHTTAWNCFEYQTAKAGRNWSVLGQSNWTTTFRCSDWSRAHPQRYLQQWHTRLFV